MLLNKATFKPSGTAMKPAGSALRDPAGNAAAAPPIRRTSARLSVADRIGGMLVRWDIGRNRYRVESGLHAIGDPDGNSPVLVTANYKLTFDSLRKELAGVDAWILVLDTHGVNVWCAAGKGTFGTEELVRRIRITGLSKVAAHRELILPQLGAPGVAAHEVKKETGFSVRYGPVYARDIKSYLAGGKSKTERMREVEFGLLDRLAVAPVEIAHAWPFLLATVALSFLFALPFGPGNHGRLVFALWSLTGGVFAGTVLFPALLPVLPTRAFSLKGAFLGILWNAGAAFLAFGVPAPEEILALHEAVLVSVPLVAYLSLNFTGASTFTSQKGAETEVNRSLGPMAVSAFAGIVSGVVNAVLPLFGKGA